MRKHSMSSDSGGVSPAHDIKQATARWVPSHRSSKYGYIGSQGDGNHHAVIGVMPEATSQLDTELMDLNIYYVLSDVGSELSLSITIATKHER